MMEKNDAVERSIYELLKTQPDGSILLEEKFYLFDFQNLKSDTLVGLIKRLLEENVLDRNKLRDGGYRLKELLEITKTIPEDELERVIYTKLVNVINTRNNAKG
jgi:hypothetical protein